MDVDKSGNYGDWRDNVVVFKLPYVPGGHGGPFSEKTMKIRKYLIDKAEVTPMLCVKRKDLVMATFIDAADSKKCKAKIPRVNDITYRDTMMWLHFEKWDQTLKSKWITMDGLKENTTRQHIIDYIKKNGNILVNEKDIYIGRRSLHNFFAKIQFRSNSDAQKVVQTLNLSELNGSKMVIEMRLPPEGKSKVLFLSNLDMGVRKQDIANHIKKHGKIETPPTSIELLSFKNHKKSTITLASNEDLVKTMRNLNCTQLKGKEVGMTWKSSIWRSKKYCNYGDWRDNVVVFTLPRVRSLPKQRKIQIRRYLMNEAEVKPLLYLMMQREVMVSFIDSADSKKCKGKIKCLSNLSCKKFMMKLDLKFWDLKFKSEWVTMDGLKENTTRQQIIDYIKTNGNIEVNEKDIYISRSHKYLFARIKCQSNSDAQKLVQNQKLSELNGSKMLIEMGLPLEEKRTVLILSNLDEDVTEQDIADHIKEHGKIETPPTSIKLRGKGNQKNWEITFASNEDLVQTMRNLNCTELKGKDVFMTWRIPKLRPQVRSNRVTPLTVKRRRLTAFKMKERERLTALKKKNKMLKAAKKKRVSKSRKRKQKEQRKRKEKSKMGAVKKV